MNQWLKVLAIFAEDLHSSPTTYMIAQNHLYLRIPGIQCPVLA